ncbi:hypothetical protein MLD38_003623 [Melastoma candidum]|uniref:Uncharacterized protein n=1 Tax=Melastoma candidum TaxID=119954 RepID=A0ACB9S2E2_9MYRT|nr:hypothetical protein MLD38_003623 [Melastoma candidum]
MAQSRGLTFFLFFLCSLSIFLISGLQQSGASPSGTSIKMLGRARNPDNASHSGEVSPSPSPSVLPDMKKVKERDAPTLLFVVPPAPSPSNSELALAVDPCPSKSRTCSAKNFTACLQLATNEKESFLIIQKSEGEIPVEVNITFVPSNVTSNETWSTAHPMKVNVTDGILGSSSIVVNIGGEGCILKLNPEVHRQLNPGQSILVCLVIVIGVGAWGYYVYRYRRSRRRATGSAVRIPYKRVEARDIETGKKAAADWNEGWGEDWDKGKAVSGLLQKKNGGSSSPAISSHKAD